MRSPCGSVASAQLSKIAQWKPYLTYLTVEICSVRVNEEENDARTGPPSPPLRISIGTSTRYTMLLRTSCLSTNKLDIRPWEKVCFHAPAFLHRILQCEYVHSNYFVLVGCLTGDCLHTRTELTMALIRTTLLATLRHYKYTYQRRR